jgi:hypothetical protein
VLASESGIAVPIALAVLLTTVLLATVATGLAIQTSQTSTRDARSKAAIEAADAGLRAAIYRLNSYQPDANYCPTEPTNFQVGTNGAPTSTLCPADGPGVSQGLGNGATYSYWISRAMQSGDSCTGPSVASSQDSTAQRCITGVGTANGVSARVQERVAAYTSAPAFPTAVFGTKAVTVDNNVTMTSDTPGSPALLGSNGILNAGGTGGGTTVIDGYQLPPGVTAQIGKNVTNLGPTTPNPSQYANPTPIYPFSTATNTSSPYDTATTNQGGTCSQTEAQSLFGWSGTWVQTNCDYEISRGIQYSTGQTGCVNIGLPVTDCDVSTGLDSTDFDSVGRTLYLPNNSTLVLGGGYYNFCSLYLSNNSQISIVGGQATIFIDSPNDQNACPTAASNHGVAAGTFTMSQNSAITAASALDAQILVFGDQVNTPPQNAVSLQNNGNSTFALLAPYSNVSVNPSNNSTFRGAIVGYTVTLGNASNFTYEADTKSFQSTAVPVYYPSYWTQCPTQSTSSTDPTAGC